MEYIINTVDNLIHQTSFFNLQPGTSFADLDVENQQGLGMPELHAHVGRRARRPGILSVGGRIQQVHLRGIGVPGRDGEFPCGRGGSEGRSGDRGLLPPRQGIGQEIHARAPDRPVDGRRVRGGFVVIVMPVGSARTAGNLVHEQLVVEEMRRLQAAVGSVLGSGDIDGVAFVVEARAVELTGLRHALKGRFESDLVRRTDDYGLGLVAGGQRQQGGCCQEDVFFHNKKD